MKTKYVFNYNVHEAEVSFIVDDQLFTEQIAKDLLEYYVWNFNKKANPIQEAMKKIAMTAIKLATLDDLTVYGVKSEFNALEAYPKLDGTSGVELISISKYEFDISSLEFHTQQIAA